jgi:hypothetical protein
MAVNKPRNINDEDLVNGALQQEEEPSSQPTIMSYFLQRLRLAEICRISADRSSSSGPDSEAVNRSNVIYLDAELRRLGDDLPAFFQLGLRGGQQQHYNDNTPMSGVDDDDDNDPRQRSMIRVHRYLINTLLHAQRCKVNLPYLVRGLVEAEYVYSRHACVDAARAIVQNELRFEEEQMGGSMLLKHSRSLYGLFVGNTVFVLDASCMDKDAGRKQQQPLYRDEAVQGLRMLEDASRQSPSAAKVLDSLRQYLHRHMRPPFPEPWRHFHRDDGLTTRGVPPPPSFASPTTNFESIHWIDRSIHNGQEQPSSGYPGAVPPSLDDYSPVEAAGLGDWTELFGGFEGQMF